MLYRNYKDKEKVSLLGFGAMRLPKVGKGEEIDYDKAKALIDQAYAAGVNYYDTAYVYHDRLSEPFLAKALAEYPRDSYYLATKLPMWLIKTPEDAQRLFEEQLAALNTDYFDFYLMHALNSNTVDLMENLKLWEMADQWRKEGKIKNLGFSFHDQPPVLERICKTWQWDFGQLMYNYIDEELTKAQEQYEMLERYHIPCIIMEPVRGGRLADLGPKSNAILKEAAPQRSIASWAMRWLAGKENILTILSGMNTPEQLTDNVDVLSKAEPFTPQETQALNEAVALFREYALIPCTACGYCMPCPSGVDIPGMMALYNDCAFDSNTYSLKEKYAKVPEGERAGNCISCGACETVCPQHLPISEIMTKMGQDATQ